MLAVRTVLIVELYPTDAGCVFKLICDLNPFVIDVVILIINMISVLGFATMFVMLC